MGLLKRLFGRDDSLVTIRSERTEQVLFTFQFIGERLAELWPDLQQIVTIVPTIVPNDIVTGTFMLKLDYEMGLVSKLQALRRMKQAGVIVKVDIEEINYCESILIALLDELRALRT